MTVGHDLHYAAGSVAARGYYAQPQNGAIRGAVILVHEAPGVGPHLRRKSDALAAQGYAVLAADLHGDGRLAASPPEARQWVEALKADPAELIARMNGALDAWWNRAGQIAATLLRAATALAAGACSNWRAAAHRCAA